MFELSGAINLSDLSKQDIIINIRSEVENINQKLKNHPKISEKIIKITEISKKGIGYSDPDFLRILDSLDNSIEKFIEFNSIQEAGNIADIYLDLLIDFKNEPELINRSKKTASAFFNRNETTYFVIAEDIINRVSDYLENEGKLAQLGDLLIETGNYLFKRKNFEQSVAYFERGLNFHIDEKNKEMITKELIHILEIARKLAVKNNEHATNYIELANRVSIESGINLKNEPNAQLAYQSYSEHLLKKSKTMVEDRKVPSGRLHKKKRNLSTLFKKKEKTEEYY